MRSARSPRRRPPRSRRARATRWTLSINCGARVTATATAIPSSYSAPGSIRSARLGLASALAAPMQQSIVPSRRPSTAADSIASSDTGPPIWTPEYHFGVGMCGKREEDVIGRRDPGGEHRAEHDAKDDHEPGEIT